MLVKPPGMTAMSVFVSLTARLTESTRWALNESHISKLFFLGRPPGRAFQIFWTPIFKPSSSIQPLGWQWTTAPAGKFSFGMVFLLKITVGFNFVPSARHDRTTVKWDFSWPVVLTNTVLSFPNSSCRRHVKPIWGFHPYFQYGQVHNSSPYPRLMTKRWKLVIFSSKSSGSFWAILVFCRNTKFLLRRNLVHRLFVAWKSEICW